MKYILPYLSFLSVFHFSCAKIESESTSNLSFKYSNLENKGRHDFLLQGYHNMSFLFKETCLVKNKFTYPKNIENMIIKFEENLKENDFRNKLNIGGASGIPMELIDISLGVNYSKVASVSKLSRSFTYFAYARLGELKAKGDEKETLVIHDSFRSNFDEKGNLINPYEFIQKCGDEAVTSKTLSSKLIITLKLSFDNQKALDEFNTKIGSAFNAFITDGGQFNSSIHLKRLASETRKQIRLNLYGFQLGGQPKKMLDLLSIKNSCRLDNVEECQDIFKKLNLYISSDYKMQLDENDLSLWSFENIKTTPYAQLNIADSSGVPLFFQWTNNFNDSNKLADLKTKISCEILKQTENHNLANHILSSSNLALDEKNELALISNQSLQNINLLKNFSIECYKNLNDCLNNLEKDYSKLISIYDEFLLSQSKGTLISKVRSNNAPFPQNTHRSSDDFLRVKSLIRGGKYSSIYFKIKTIDNNLIRDNKVRFNIKCNRKWYEGFDTVFLSDIFPNYEVLIDTVENKYQKYCTGKNMLYIADPQNVSETDFIVEIWGRE